MIWDLGLRFDLRFSPHWMIVLVVNSCYPTRICVRAGVQTVYLTSQLSPAWSTLDSPLTSIVDYVLQIYKFIWSNKALAWMSMDW
jgi:hypothetical protein